MTSTHFPLDATRRSPWHRPRRLASPHLGHVSVARELRTAASCRFIYPLPNPGGRVDRHGADDVPTMTDAGGRGTNVSEPAPANRFRERGDNQDTGV